VNPGAAEHSGGEVDLERLKVFLLEVGRALGLAGTAVSETQERLARIAAANGAHDARVVVLPTALMIDMDGAGGSTVEAVPQLTGTLRLDQISVLYGLVKRAEHGELPLADGLREVRAIRAMRPRHGRVVTVLGHTMMTVGLCLVLQPTLLDAAVAAVFGALVGTLILLARGHRVLNVLIPVLATMIVSALTFVAVREGVVDPGLRTLIAPLITFLPGGMLTTATVELASGEMVAGASRLVYGGMQLLLLAFGIIAGVELAGLPSGYALADSQQNLLGWWGPWLGVLLFGAATAVYFSAPRGTLRWLLLVLFAAWLGQLAGGWLVGPDVSGFFGALVMTPVALAVADLPGGPPSQVTFLPAFWLLVPGAIGLIGVTEVVGNPAAAGLEDLVDPLASIVAIALGVLCGASMYRGLAATPWRPHRLPWSRSHPERAKRADRPVPMVVTTATTSGQENTMTTLTVWKFDTPQGADEAVSTLEVLAKQELITIHDAATVSWAIGAKKPKTRQLRHLTSGGAMSGMFWGMLFGLIFLVPFLGAAIGAAAGALAGSLTDVGINDQFIKKVRDEIAPGTSALFLMSGDAVVEKVRSAMDDGGHAPELLRSNLTTEQEVALREMMSS
jgi:uncharacterized membrane protein/uncharacterized membrane protein YjjP (DUF1212 family)